jgi:hypothetical protein
MRKAQFAPPRFAATNFLLLTVVCLLAVVPADGQDTDPTQATGFVPLFDGMTFNGWEGDRTFFRIADGAIVAGSLTSDIPANAFLCTTSDYDDFELRLKAKLVGPGDNAGIQFRSRRIANHHEVSGYQADIGTVSRTWFSEVIGRTEATPVPSAKSPVWGSLYDESRRDRYLAWALPEDVEPVLNSNDWNELVVRAEGPRIQIYLNGFRTVDYTEKSHIPRSGVVCLQVHSGAPTEAWHKDISLAPITRVNE